MHFVDVSRESEATAVDAR